jgi:hypothetical protein
MSAKNQKHTKISREGLQNIKDAVVVVPFDSVHVGPPDDLLRDH